MPVIFAGTKILGLVAIFDGTKINGSPDMVTYDHTLLVGTLVVKSVNWIVDSPQNWLLLKLKLTTGLLYKEMTKLLSATQLLTEVADSLIAYTVSIFPGLSFNCKVYFLAVLVGKTFKLDNAFIDWFVIVQANW